MDGRPEVEEIAVLRERRGSPRSARTPKGVLLVGPPAARCRARSRVRPASHFSRQRLGVHRSVRRRRRQRVRKLFAMAAYALRSSSSTLNFDRQDRSATGGANDERKHTLNQLLVEWIWLTAAKPYRARGHESFDTLDAAQFRPGRFFVDRPTASAAKILKVCASSR